VLLAELFAYNAPLFVKMLFQILNYVPILNFNVAILASCINFFYYANQMDCNPNLTSRFLVIRLENPSSKKSGILIVYNLVEQEF